MLRGLIASLLSSVLFAAMYYITPQLLPLNAEQVFGWRVLLTLPFTSLLLLAQGQRPQLGELLGKALACPTWALLLALSAALLGVQLWLFLWAPLNGMALPTSLGYFLMPLIMVLAGRCFFAERLRPLQWLAVALAAAGVAYEFARAGQLAWVTWAVALGFSAYFVLRRRLQTDHLAGHWLDLALLCPVALHLVFFAGDAAGLTAWQRLQTQPHLPLWVLALGLLSAAALALYMTAHARLPLALFGMLSYVEPILLVGVALILGERIQPGQGPLYAALGLAMGSMALDGLRQWLTIHNRKDTP